MAAEVGRVGLLEGWMTALDEAGSLYFWNTLTRETSWDLPLPASGAEHRFGRFDA